MGSLRKRESHGKKQTLPAVIIQYLTIPHRTVHAIAEASIHSLKSKIKSCKRELSPSSSSLLYRFLDYFTFGFDFRPLLCQIVKLVYTCTRLKLIFLSVMLFFQAKMVFYQFFLILQRFCFFQI